MKKKIIGIFICMLLIITMIFPVTGKTTMSSTIDLDSNGQPISFNSNNSKLKFMIAGSALRCLRFYRIYIPSSYDGSEPVPLVLALHGSSGMGEKFKPAIIFYFYRDTFFESYSDLNLKAEEEGFIVVYPKALAFFSPLYSYYLFSFNVLEYPDSVFRRRNLIDDLGFIADLIDKMQSDYNIDSDRVYITGLSGGADMVHSSGSWLSDKVAAIAPVAGAAASKDAADEDFTYPPDPENPVSVIIFHGTSDNYYPWNGDEWGCSVNDSVQFWVEHNGCNPVPEINVSDSGKIVRYTYLNGTDGAEVILYKTVGGGHWWPGNDFTDPDNIAPWLVDTIQEISATDLMWEFFKEHPKQ